MAYIKIFPIKVTDKKALDYITNPDKTDEKLLVSSFGCSPETADLEFAMTREMAKKNGMDKGDNLAFHLIQSFKPGEVDAETAHRLGQQFADEVLKGKYEYVISTHVDKNHIHNHIIFNAANFVDHHKYVSNKRSYHKICRISNRICHENGLATSMPTGEKSKSYKENMEYHRGTSWKAKLRVAVDKAIWSSINYEESKPAISSSSISSANKSCSSLENKSSESSDFVSPKNPCLLINSYSAALSNPFSFPS